MYIILITDNCQKSFSTQRKKEISGVNYYKEIFADSSQIDNSFKNALLC